MWNSESEGQLLLLATTAIRMRIAERRWAFQPDFWLTPTGRSVVWIFHLTAM
jgi:hypothetical protein